MTIMSQSPSVPVSPARLEEIPEECAICGSEEVRPTSLPAFDEMLDFIGSGVRNVSCLPRIMSCPHCGGVYQEN